MNQGAPRARFPSLPTHPSTRVAVVAYVALGAAVGITYAIIAPLVGGLASLIFLPWYFLGGWHFGLTGAVSAWVVTATLRWALQAVTDAYPTLTLEAHVSGLILAAIIGGGLALYRESRRRAEALEASEARIRQLAEASFEGVLIVEDGRIARANSVFAQLVGQERSQLKGRDLADFLGDSGATDAILAGSATEATPAEVDVRRADGTTFRAEILTRPMNTVSGVARAVAVRDVTARKEAEAALSRNERLTALGTLVAGVAHEINNPLAYIRGNIELMQLDARERLDATRDDEKWLNRMLEQSDTAIEGLDRIANITRSLKQLARTPSHVREPENLTRLASGVADIARPRVPSHVQLNLNLAPTRMVLGNGSDLARILLNLMFNAADAVARAGTTIELRTFDEAGNVVVEVQDDGGGIPAEARTRLFTPFFTTKPDGTGLGLSISHNIAKQHGGDLTFTSTEGVGTIFRLELPALTTSKEPDS